MKQCIKTGLISVDGQVDVKLRTKVACRGDGPPLLATFILSIISLLLLPYPPLVGKEGFAYESPTHAEGVANETVTLLLTPVLFSKSSRRWPSRG